jgi:hypothetical protein
MPVAEEVHPSLLVGLTVCVEAVLDIEVAEDSVLLPTMSKMYAFEP